MTCACCFRRSGVSGSQRETRRGYVRVRTTALGALVMLTFLAFTVACGRTVEPRLQVEAAWARPTAGGSSHAGGGMGNVGAVYFTLANGGGAPDRLIGVTTRVAEVAEIHQTRVQDGVARMVPVPEGVIVPPGERVVFGPGSYHVMLMGLRRPLRPGDRFTMTLSFEQSDSITVNVEVRQ